MQGKPSPAQPICPWKVNSRTVELFTSLLLTLCFHEGLSTSEFFAQAAEVPSTYFQQQKSNLTGMCPDSLAKSNDMQTDIFASGLVKGARIRDCLASTSEFPLYLLDELFNTAELLLFR